MGRVFRLKQSSKASIKLEDDSALLAGDKDHFVLANDKGVVIQGPLSFVSGSDQRRSGGLFVGTGDFTRMIPSTICTPIPSQMPMPPVFALVNIAKDLGFFMSLMV